jgi:F-type H+-transporting ATPase subunit b
MALDIDWTSFVLEIINFLVLIWLLKHFLYQPVLDIINRRQQLIAESIATAERDKQAALALMQEHEARHEAWDNERARARETLQHEIAALRAGKLEKLDAEIEAQRSKRLDIEQHQTRELLRNCESQAIGMGARFASKLLGQLASPALCEQLLQLSLQQLNTLPDKVRKQLTASVNEQQARIHVCSSHPLPEALQQTLQTRLVDLTGSQAQFSYSVDPTLIAGVAIRVDALVLDANLKAELKLFQEFSDAQ